MRESSAEVQNPVAVSHSVNRFTPHPPSEGFEQFSYGEPFVIGANTAWVNRN
jgi:hypothetical protein